MSQRKKKEYESVLICNIDGKQFKTHHQFVYHLKQLGITQQEYYDEYLKRSNLEGTCTTCKDPTGFINIIYGYKLYCSHDCAVNNIDVSKRRNENTISALIKKYGVINAGQMSTHRKKMEKTCLERYGNAHYVNPEKGKETHIKRYGKHYTGTPEYKKQYDITVKQKYGVVHHTQSDVVKNKIKSTCMKRYGANSYLKIRKDTKQSVLPKMKRFYTYIMEYCKA